ncbi:MAG: 3'(2'),5'-bisphosphate nucleotidase [Planctomycetes bacterium]|nr:3'(2'),5'-bisphosphate nucleotidase [Planctomycetota bacterium]
MTDVQKILEVAQAAGRKAAVVCRAVHAQTPESMDKGDKSPVTIADYGSQAVILRELAAAFPDHGVISEEGSEHLRESAGDEGVATIVSLVNEATGENADFDQVCAWIDHEGVDGAEYTWAIDPIDGTKGFLRRQQYAIAIGLMRNGVPFAGVMVCPNLPVDLNQPDGAKGVMYVAAQGQGCQRIPLDGGDAAAAKSSQSADPASWRVLGSVESSHGDPKLVVTMMEEAGVQGGFVRYDSQVKYGIIAEGAAEIYLRPRSKPDYRENIWDHVAGVICCQEAGGVVTDVDGKPLDFTLGKKLLENRGVLATGNPEMHEQVVAGIAAAEAALQA